MSAHGAVYDQLRHAIETRQQVTFSYRGHVRVCCPHVLGETGGKLRVLMFQHGGTSSSGLPHGGEWRAMDVHGLNDLRLAPGPWHSGGGELSAQTAVRTVHHQVRAR